MHSTEKCWVLLPECQNVFVKQISDLLLETLVVTAVTEASEMVSGSGPPPRRMDFPSRSSASRMAGSSVYQSTTEMILQGTLWLMSLNFSWIFPQDPIKHLTLYQNPKKPRTFMPVVVKGHSMLVHFHIFLQHINLIFNIRSWDKTTSITPKLHKMTYIPFSIGNDGLQIGLLQSIFKNAFKYLLFCGRL